MALNPILVSVGFYQIVLFFIDLAFIASIFWFLYIKAHKDYGLNRYIWFFISSFTVFVCYNWMPTLLEFTYNYVSGQFYALTFALALTYYCLIRVLEKRREKARQGIFAFILILLLSVFIGLNNSPTALMFWCGTAAIGLFAFINKSKIKYHLLSIVIVFGIFLVINIIAPGNLERVADEQTEKISALNAIIRSGFQALAYIFEFAYSTPVLGVMIVLTPFLLMQLKDKDVKAVNPIVLVIFSFLVYVSQFVPVMYVSGYNIYGRVENIRMITGVLFLLINYLNLICYISNREWKWVYSGFSKVLQRIVGAALLIFVVYLYTFAPAVLNDELYPYPLNIQRIVKEQQAGVYETYKREQDSRYDALEDESIKDVYFYPLTFKRPICGAEMFRSYDSNRNQVAARLYDKNIIYLIEE